MKGLRILLLVFGILAGLVLLAAVVAFLPSVQRSIALRVLNAQAGTRAEAETLKIGLGTATARNFRLERDGAVVTVPSLRATFDFWPALTGRAVRVREVEAVGWTADLSRYAPPATNAETSAPSAPAPRRGDPPANPPPTETRAPAAAPAEPFRGFLHRAHLPLKVALDRARLEGEVVFPAVAPQPPLRATVRLDGSEFGPGKTARFPLTARLVQRSAEGVESAIESRGEMLVAQSAAGAIDSLSLQLELTPRAPAFPQAAPLRVAASLARSGEGETGEMSLASEKAPAPLARATFGFSAPGQPLAGEWTLALRREDVAPFALGQPLPAFTAQGGGTFSFQPAARSGQAAGTFTLDASELETLRPELREVGAVKAQSDFAASLAGDRVTVTTFSAVLSRAGQPLLQARALQPATIDLATFQPVAVTGDLAEISLQQLPLGLAAAFLPGLSLQGSVAEGRLVAAVEGERLLLRSLQPISVTGLSASLEGRPLLRNLTLTLSPGAELTSGGVRATTGAVRVNEGNTELLRLDGKATLVRSQTDPTATASATFEGDLAALLRQPALAGFNGLSRGRWRGEAGLSNGPGPRTAQAQIFLEELVGREGGQPLPRAEMTLRADLAADGAIALQAPVVLTAAERRSDLTVAAHATLSTDPALPGGTFDARLTGQRVIVADLRALAAAFSGVEEPAPAPKPAPRPAPPRSETPTPPSAPPAPERQAPWHGWKGQAGVEIQEVVFPDGRSGRMAAIARVDDTKLALERAQFRIDDQSLIEAAGELRFESGQAEPYALSVPTFSADFDPAPILKALQPNEPPALEGRIRTDGKVEARARSLDQLAARMEAEVALDSRDGVFRYLAGKIESANRASGAVAAIGSLLGKRDVVEGAADFNEFLAALSALRYDQLSARLVKSASGQAEMKEFVLMAPLIRLTGGGSLSPVPEKGPLHWPMNLRFQVGVREKWADSLQKRYLVSGQLDEFGYARVDIPLVLPGTLANPDRSKLFSEWFNAALRAGARGFLGGEGK